MKRLIFSWPAIMALGLFSVLAWAAALSMPDQKLHVSFIDVGEGDAILVRAGSLKVLIDGGPSPQAIDGYLGRTLPFWDRHIDLVISTHPHDDHLTGLMEVAQRYDIGGVLATSYEHDSTLYQQWRSLIDEKRIPYVLASRGQQVRLGEQALLDVLHPGERLMNGTPSDVNNNSIVLRLVSGSFSALLGGDIEQDGESDLLGRQADLGSTVLKVPHQGASNALGLGFLERVHPALAVISTGQGNPFGHPAPETLDKLKGVELYRTDLNGTIEIATDGLGYTVSTSRRSQ